MMTTTRDLGKLARLVRTTILQATTAAGSGHPSSSLSATDLMTVLFFHHLRFDCDHPENPANDRVIFSKGHAAPLLYALYAAAGAIDPGELKNLRRLGSPLEGHPTPRFRFAEAATGSLGQGLSVGVGMALNAKYLDRLPYRTFVLLGDGEMAEGQVWEAMEIASYYKLGSLVGIIDVNRWGQSQETMLGHDVETFAQRARAFGWKTVVLDGHSLPAIDRALSDLLADPSDAPKMIVAKTLKGKGVSFLEDKAGWHGKALNADQLKAALAELGEVEAGTVGTVERPTGRSPASAPAVSPIVQQAGKGAAEPPPYRPGELVATRKAYGEALARLVERNPSVVSLDGDVKNSTFAEIVAQRHTDRYFEMFIAEQNMVGVAVGLAQRGKIPFVSSFAAFLTRAFDQIRMAAVTGANIKFAGSHVGVSIGEDGPSQMGLEDLAMFRAVGGSTVLYPADAVATAALVEEAARLRGIVYIRTNRPATPVLYEAGEKFPVGGSKVLRSGAKDVVTIVAAGVTLNESLVAFEELKKGGIPVRLIDAYSIKPIDAATLQRAVRETRGLVVVEDHWAEGGLGDAVRAALTEGVRAPASVPIRHLAVRRMAASCSPAEQLEEAGISARHIVRAVKELV